MLKHPNKHGHQVNINECQQLLNLSEERSLVKSAKYARKSFAFNRTVYYTTRPGKG